MNSRLRLFAILGLASLLGCEPITYSHESKIDFTRYRSVSASVNGGNQNYTDYLVAELRSVSGFEEVSVAPASTDVRLEVVLDVEIVTSVDSDGNTQVDYHGSAEYVLTDRRGTVLLTGGEADTSFSYTETAEDTLDQVAEVFLAPYRI